MANEITKDGSAVDKKLKGEPMTKHMGDAEIPVNLIPLKSSLDNYYLDSQITYLKHSLKDVREVILYIKSVLIWDKQWHPYSLVGGSSIIFMFLWLAEPSLLTTISTLGLLITLTDYFLPTILSSFVNHDNWSVTKEKELEDVCRTIVLYKTKLSTSTRSFYLLRTTRPKLYYGAVIVILTFFAWIGNVFNNLFLTYLLLTSLILVPGLEKQGILPKYRNILSQKLCEFSTSAKSMTAKNKKE